MERKCRQKSASQKWEAAIFDIQVFSTKLLATCFASKKTRTRSMVNGKPPSGERKCRQKSACQKWEVAIFDIQFFSTKLLKACFASKKIAYTINAEWKTTKWGEKMLTKKCQSLHPTSHFEYTILFDKTFRNTKP